MLNVIAFFFAGRLSWTRRTLPDLSVTISGACSGEIVATCGALSSVEELMAIPIDVVDEHQTRLDRGLPLHEGAEAGDGLADNQVLHLIRAFVGVERLGIVEEARDIVIGNDAVAAQDLTAPGHRLPRFRRAECLREGRMVILQLSPVMLLRHTD